MKRFILIAVLVGALAALLAGTALAAGPVNPPVQGFGPGMGRMPIIRVAWAPVWPVSRAAGRRRGPGSRMR
jgi:hypothetical protein